MDINESTSCDFGDCQPESDVEQKGKIISTLYTCLIV